VRKKTRSSARKSSESLCAPISICI
jgi:hypothetical protein